MKRIKDYFKGWGLARIIRIILGGLLLTAFYFNREQLYLMVGIMLTFQAVFNISCPGGSCSTSVDKNAKPIVEVKKYEPGK